jgi:LmbE family N-acetylglucosaminyl deacetylase
MNQLLVIAPHPDDEILIASGLLAHAKDQGHARAVAILTNGDRSCERDGYLRQRESVTALARAGVAASDVYFLGYPDGHLGLLGALPLQPLERRASDGSCSLGNTTYGEHGFRHADFHRAIFGASAPYTAHTLMLDMQELLSRLLPRTVSITHGIDDHLDHAMTYAYFRRALDALGQGTWYSQWRRLARDGIDVQRSIVHAGPCWPTDCATFYTPKVPLPDLPAPHSFYKRGIRRRIDPAEKMAQITVFSSQLDAAPEHDWLAGFARVDELYYPETLKFDTDAGRWLPVLPPTANRTWAQIEVQEEGLIHLQALPNHRLDWRKNELRLDAFDGKQWRRVRAWEHRLPLAQHLALLLDLRQEGEMELTIYAEDGFWVQEVLTVI